MREPLASWSTHVLSPGLCLRSREQRDDVDVCEGKPSFHLTLGCDAAGTHSFLSQDRLMTAMSNGCRLSDDWNADSNSVRFRFPDTAISMKKVIGYAGRSSASISCSKGVSLKGNTLAVVSRLLIIFALSLHHCWWAMSRWNLADFWGAFPTACTMLTGSQPATIELETEQKAVCCVQRSRVLPMRSRNRRATLR